MCLSFSVAFLFNVEMKNLENRWNELAWHRQTRWQMRIILVVCSAIRLHKLGVKCSVPVTPSLLLHNLNSLEVHYSC